MANLELNRRTGTMTETGLLAAWVVPPRGAA